MGIFRNRPLAFACVVSALAALFCYCADLSFVLPISIALFSVGCGLLILFSFLRRMGFFQVTAILSLLLSSVLLFSSWMFFGLQVRSLADSDGKTVAAEGIVTERLETDQFYSQFAMTLTELDGAKTSRRVILSCEYLSALRVGERVRVNAKVSSFSEHASETVAYRIADGYSGMLTCSESRDCSLISNENFYFRMRLSQWNARLSERLSECIGGERGGLAAALLLGNRSYLHAADTLNFRRAGVSHLLALSGLHVGILIAAIERFLRLLRVPRIARVFPMIGLSVAYLMLTGGAPSTTRAVIMATLLSCAFLVRRSYDAFTAVSVALFLILAVQPYAIADVGLWLSFCAAGSIVIFFPAVRKAFERHGRAPRGVRRYLERFGKALIFASAVGLFAFSATLPLTAAFFGEVSILSVPVTLILSPFITVGLVLSILSLLLPLPPVLFLTGKVMGVMRGIVLFASNRRGITVLLQDGATRILIVLMTVMLLLFAVLRLKRRILLGIPVLLTVAALISAYFAVQFGSPDVRATYSNQGTDEFLLFSSGRKAVAVDLSTGNRNYASRLADALHEDGYTELEELVLTHYHATATYLVDRVATKMKVRTLRLPVPLNESETAIAARIQEEAERYGIACILSDECRTIKGLTLQTVHDAANGETAALLFAKASEQSLVWFTPRARSSEQSILLTDQLMTADSIIVGVHGISSQRTCKLPQNHASTVILGGGADRLSVQGIQKETTLLTAPLTYRFRLQ